MRLRTATAATVSILVAVSGLLAGASPAAAYTPPIVVSPANGGTLLSNSTGPLVIDFPTPGEYSVTVECGSDLDYYWSNDLDSYYSGQTTIDIDPLYDDIAEKDLTGKTCTIEVFSWDQILEGDVTAAFTIAPPPLSLGDIHVTKKTFYPLVKDKYLDETEFVLNTSRSTDVTLTIADTRGKEVYVERARFADGAGRYEWPWRGKTTSGKPVKPGKYRATLTATADGVTVSKNASVRVATKTITRKQTLRKGPAFGRDSTRGNCYTSYDSYNDVTTMDCWGGVFAATTFTFTVPPNATSIRWGARTGRATLDRCCHGSITKRGHRVGKTKVQVRVQVTGWRATEVYGAWASYKARVQI